MKKFLCLRVPFHLKLPGLSRNGPQVTKQAQHVAPQRYVGMKYCDRFHRGLRQNLVFLRCCFAEDGEEMGQEL